MRNRLIQFEHVSRQAAAIYLFQGEHWRLSSRVAHLTCLNLQCHIGQDIMFVKS